MSLSSDSSNVNTMPPDNLHNGVSAPLGVLSGAQSADGRTAPEPEILDLLLVLAKNKWRIFRITAAGGILSLGIALLLPNTYTATTLVMPPQQGQSAASALLGQLGGLAAMAGSASLGLKSPSDLYIGMLGSRTISDALIDKYNLLKVYDVNTRTDATDKLASHRKFSAGKDSLIHIDVDDHDPKRASDMANSFAKELNATNSAIAANEAAQKSAFLEKHLNDEKAAMTAAEDEMKNLQQDSGVLQIDSQVRVSLMAIAQLKAEIAAQEVMLDRMRLGATAENPEVVGAEAELSGLREQLKKLEDSPSGRAAGDPFVPMSKLPSAGLSYLRKLREVKFHEFLFELLTKQYEITKLDESKQTPALPVVDWAVPPDKKSGPHRSVIVLAGILLSGLLSSAVICLSHNMKQQKRANPKFQELQQALFGSRS
jgi:uncharacterized protein involved in exopolysaccharide biosynthesis